MQIIFLGAWCWVGVVVDANQLFGHCQLIMIDDFDTSHFDERPYLQFGLMLMKIVKSIPK